MRRLAALLASFVIATGWLATPRPGDALVNATMSISSSPNPSVTTTTIKVVIKFAAPVTDIVFWLERQGGYNGINECNPECSNFSLSGEPHWSMASASGTVTATFVTNAAPGRVDYLYHTGFSSTLPTLQEKNPTVTTTLSRSPTGVLMPGDPLHITVRSTANAAGMGGDLWVVLPAGVSPPTNLPAGAVYEGWGAVHKPVTEGPGITASYGFDVVVQAAVGTTLTFQGYLNQISSWDKGAKLTFTVGVAPTPRPTATPKPTKKPTTTAAPTVVPSASPTPVAATDTPAPMVTALATPSTTAPADFGEPSPLGSPAPSGGPALAPASQDLGGVALGAVLVLVIGLVVGGLWFARRRGGSTA